MCPTLHFFIHWNVSCSNALLHRTTFVMKGSMLNVLFRNLYKNGTKVEEHMLLSQLGYAKLIIFVASEVQYNINNKNCIKNNEFTTLNPRSLE